MNNLWRNILWSSILAVVVAGMGGLVALWLGSQKPAVDRPSGCRRDDVLPAHVVILVDQSDPFREGDIQWVHKVLSDETRNVEEFGKITLLSLQANSYETKQVFYHCSPGNPDRSNKFLENRQFIELEWRRHLYKPLIAAADTMLNEKTQSASPLAEAMVEILGRADFTAQVGRRRIVIVSDMLQHSSEYSFLKYGLNSDAFEQSLPARRLGSMSGVAVAVHIVPRRSYSIEPSRLEATWRKFFEQRGATFDQS